MLARRIYRIRGDDLGRTFLQDNEQVPQRCASTVLPTLTSDHLSGVDDPFLAPSVSAHLNLFTREPGLIHDAKNTAPR